MCKSWEEPICSLLEHVTIVRLYIAVNIFEFERVLNWVFSNSMLSGVT